LDSFGNPLVHFLRTPVVNGEIKTPTGNFIIMLPLTTGQPPIMAEFKKARMEFTIDPQLKSLSDGKVGGALPASVLDRVNAIMVGSILELLIQLFEDFAQPDIDLDNDGLETFSRQNNYLECTDGDKTNVPVPSPCPAGMANCTCAQHSKIADGYSSFMKFDATETKIVP
jgi:hypothetical protein